MAHNRYDVTDPVAFLFRETLKMKRRAMNAGARARSRNPNIRVQWLYPHATEREYQRYIIDIMKIFSGIAIPTLRNNGQRWIEEQRGDAIRADDFNTELQQLVTRMQNTQRDIFDEGGEGEEGFSRGAILAALAVFGFAVSRFNQKQSNKFEKRILGEPFIPEEAWLPGLIEEWAQLNFDLIKSLSDEYIKKVNFIVRDGVLEGRVWDDIMGDIRRMDRNITRNRARLIARDQIGKLNGRLTARRNKEAGVSYYEWLTARDERVRSTHRPLHGKICDWADNSVYADTVEDAIAGNWKSRSSIKAFIGIPGQDIQCRCTSAPVYTDMIREVDEEIEKEKVI